MKKSAKLPALNKYFDSIAVDGFVGDPNGQPAWAYLRVSSEEQAEEDRSGLPRQLDRIAETAKKQSFKIPWTMIYVDDDTGFEYEDRPELTKLRNEFVNPNRKANVVIMEEIDRLSREATWQQGYLLHEMKKSGIRGIFWKPYTSEIERSVLGIVAQQGMEQAKQRMTEGKLHKARSGRVTASVPAYGYKLVDAQGNEGLAAKRETYYAIRLEEANVVRLIYKRVLSGDPMRKVALELQMAGVKPPKQSKYWEPTQVRLFIRNEVYKGDFYAHRWEHKTVQKIAKSGNGTRKVQRKVERPREEWIHVPVPALVSVEDWEAANRMLDMNRKMSRRNAKQPYLLTGLVRCAHCGCMYMGTTRHLVKGKKRNNPYRGYRCPHLGVRPKYLREHDQCINSQITCEVLDGVVWELVCKALLQPEILTKALDADATSERNRQLESQIAFLEGEIANKTDHDEKLLRVYLIGGFDEHEYADRRKQLKEEIARQQAELTRIRAQVLTQEQLEERKRLIFTMSQQMQERGVPVDPPFELKQRVIKLVVDEITLSVAEGWLELKGAIREAMPVESTHAPAVIMAIR